MKKTYLGIDCGSLSVKFALIDKDKNLLRSVYLRNQGLIETVKQGLKEIQNGEYIHSVGATGSGRKFVGMLVNADVVKTEVLAHTIGALNYYPNVRTLMDIGGEDSKLMSIRNGVLENFIMNSSCSAGTGSFLEAIATRMGIKIEDVGDLALQSKQRLNFPSKCGVFTQSAVVSKLNSGADKSDILMGISRALANNYLTMAKGIRLSAPYVYQGATAKNKAVVRALEEQLESRVIVPEYCDVMGAIGIAIISQKHKGATRFKGFKITNYDFKTKIRECSDCENHCELNEIYENNKLMGTLNSRCGKY